MSRMFVQSEAMSLSDVMAPGQFYRIPAYQRSYSWQETDALNLLQDLLDAIVQERSHFLGAIVKIKTDTESIHEVADGQQRLTTLSMILSILRDLTSDDARKARLQSLICDPQEQEANRLTLNHIDAPYFRALLRPVRVISQRDYPDVKSESHELLRQNHISLSHELADVTDEMRKKLEELMLSECPIISVTVENRDEGYKVFQVLNARGRQPSGHDILKTELFERAELTGEEADKHARRWSDYEARLTSKGLDDLLRQIRMLYDRAPKGNLVSGFCHSVLEQFSAKEFLDVQLPKYVDAYGELHRGSLEFSRPIAEINGHLERLRSLEHSGWRAPALKFLVSHDRDADTAREFFCDLERLAFAMQLIVSDRDARPRRYRKLCEEIDTDKSLFSKSGALTLTTEEREKLTQRLTGRFGSVSQRRALCLKVNALLPGGEELPLSSDATVEHILPRGVGDGSEWLESWPDLATRRELTDTLGNFCLLTKSDNQKADRLSFEDKRDRFFRSTDRGGRFAITREATNYKAWSPEIVKSRTGFLVSLLVKDWKLDLPQG